MTPFFLVTLFVFGLAIGSFLNVVAYRSIHGGSILLDTSHCPHCKHKLGVSDLIPIVSYLFLKGSCRYCNKKISAQYPIVEVASGVLFALTAYYWILGVSSISFLEVFQLVYLLFMVSVLLVLLVTDVKNGLLPNSIVLSSIGVIIAYKLFLLIFGSISLPALSVDMGAALLASAGFFAIVYFSGERAMGGGDVKLVFLIGLAVGWPAILVAIFLGFLTGAALAVMLILRGKKRFGQTIPFGPFLALGAFVSLFWGQELINIYLKVLTG